MLKTRTRANKVTTTCIKRNAGKNGKLITHTVYTVKCFFHQFNKHCWIYNFNITLIDKFCLNSVSCHSSVFNGILCYLIGLSLLRSNWNIIPTSSSIATSGHYTVGRLDQFLISICHVIPLRLHYYTLIRFLSNLETGWILLLLSIDFCCCCFLHQWRP